MMRNVYDTIQKFYSSLDEQYPPISQFTVEGYLRRAAWHGASEEELQQIWHTVGWLLNYFLYVGIEELDEMDDEEYARAIVWIEENSQTFDLSPETLDALLGKFTIFYKYLADKRIVSKDHFAAAEIKKMFFKNGRFLKPEFEDDDFAIFHEGFDESELVRPEVRDRLNQIVERLLKKIGAYFKQGAFIEDFNRALILYTGPFNTMPENDNENFWMGFWDYFLFDYHLLDNDERPLEYFYEQQRRSLSVDELHIIGDLLQTEFTVFSIAHLCGNAMISCRDLLTGAEFKLPMPDFGLQDYKNVILYGHIHPSGVLMLNYITSTPVSPNFRKRIREEILRQKEIYGLQKPGATLLDFYHRHAIVVRHTIDIFVNVARVNVTPADYLAFTFPPRQSRAPVPPAVKKTMLRLAAKYRFSLHSRKLLLLLAKDFFDLNETTRGNEEHLAGALFLVFAEITSGRSTRQNDVLRYLHMTREMYKSYRDVIYEVLQLHKFDPRYLNEEGFVISLYEF